MHLPKEFFLAACGPEGEKAPSSPVFTVEVPCEFRDTRDACRPHYTYRVTYKPTENGNGLFFVGLLAGPDNLRDYTYMGMLHPHTGDLRLTRASRLTDSSWPFKLLKRLFARVWASDHKAFEAHGFDLHHLGKCGRCGKALTKPNSVKCGFGQTCADKMGIPWG